MFLKAENAKDVSKVEEFVFSLLRNLKTFWISALNQPCARATKAWIRAYRFAAANSTPDFCGTTLSRVKNRILTL
jgi:hypothetical protein